MYRQWSENMLLTENLWKYSTESSNELLSAGIYIPALHGSYTTTLCAGITDMLPTLEKSKHLSHIYVI